MHIVRRFCKGRSASLSIKSHIPGPCSYYKLTLNHNSRLKQPRHVSKGTSVFDTFLTSILISFCIQEPNNYKIVQLPQQNFQIPKSRYFQRESVSDFSLELLTQSLR